MYVRVAVRFAIAIVVLCALALTTRTAAAAVVCTSNGNTVTCTGGPASHVAVANGDGTTIAASNTSGSSFPSTINVTGGLGVVTGIRVALHGWTSLGGGGYTGSQLIGLMLVSPGGQNLELMRCVGTGSAESNLTLALQDTFQVVPNCSGTMPLVSGTYGLGSYPDGFENEPNYTAAGAPVLAHAAATNGSSTLASVFDGGSPNGSWKLYLVSDADSGLSSDVQFSSWDIVITGSGGTPTTTTLLTNAAGSETTEGASVTLTATVSASGGVSEGTVTFTDGANPVSGCSSVAVASGTAQCLTSFLAEGAHTLGAHYSGDSNYLASNGSANLFVDHATTSSGAQYCNAGGIAISGSLSGTNNPATPYPSHIKVSGYSGVISGATLTLNGFSDANPEQTAMVLVGPTGTNIVPWNDVGGNAAVSNISFTLADGAGSTGTIPAPPADGDTYYPTAETGLGAAAFPAGTPPFGPPGTLSYAAPEGTQTLNAAFGGISPNGYWGLYLYSRTGSTAVSATSWCINLLPPPTLSVASSHTDPFTQGDTADPYTITVTNTGVVATSGTISLTDTLPSGLSAVSFAETGHTGGGTGSDWSCSGTSCTRTSAMAAGEQDTLTLTVSVGFNTATGSVTNTVHATGGSASNSPTANDSTTIDGGPVQVTFNTEPAGLTYSVNGTQYSTQQTLALTNGSAVTLATTSPQTLSGEPYQWLSWSDGGTLSHTATISSTGSAVSYTATFAPNGGATVWIVNGAGGLVELSDSGAAVNPAPFTGGNGPLAIDATGNVWTLNSGPTLLYATNQLGTVEHSIASGGGIEAPVGIAIDGASQIWVTNGNGSVSEFSNAGAAVSPAAGFTDPSLATPGGIAVDLSGSVWIANHGNNSVTRILGAAAPAAPVAAAAANGTTGTKP